MNDYKFTDYFEKKFSERGHILKKNGAFRFLRTLSRVEPQEHNRYRFWGKIDELEGRILRVITLADKTTIHNAFPDRRYKP